MQHFGVRYTVDEILIAFTKTQPRTGDSHGLVGLIEYFDSFEGNFTKLLSYLNSFDGTSFNELNSQGFLEEWGERSLSFLNDLEFSLFSNNQKYSSFNPVEGLAFEIKGNEIKTFILRITSQKNILAIKYKIRGVYYLSDGRGRFNLGNISTSISEQEIREGKDKYKIQYWEDDNNIDFVLFPKEYIKLLAQNFREFFLSGTIGITGDSVGEMQQNSSLKLEGYPLRPFYREPGPNGKHVMSIINGLPCPPSWGTKF